MAVQMRTSSSTDLIQTNAQVSRKNTQSTQNEAAGGGFKNFLDGSKNLSSVKNSQNMGSTVKRHESAEQTPKDSTAKVYDDVRKVVGELKEDKRFEKALEELDRAIGSESMTVSVVSENVPENVKELAQKVLDGEIDIDDIPDDISAKELMEALIALMMQKKLHPDEEDESEDALEDEDELFNPAAAAVNERNINRETTDELIRELYKLVEKVNEDEDEEKVTFLDGISEPEKPDETLASIATSELHAEQQAEEGVFEQIIDNMTETDEADVKAAAAVEAVAKTAPITAAEPAEAIPSTEPVMTTEPIEPVTAAKADIPPIPTGAAKAAVPTEPTDKPQLIEATDFVVINKTVDISEAASNVKGTSEVRTGPEQDSAANTANAVPTQTAQAVKAPEQGGQSNEAQMRFGSQAAQKSEAAGCSIDEGELGKAIESFTVKEANNVHEPTRTEAPVKADVSTAPQSRVQNASEELEMLKTAKLGKKEVGTETAPTQTTTTTALSSEQPVLFTRADGTKLEVDPSEIVEQTARIIETAIRETQQQSEYSLVLNPEELGRITVKLVKAADGAVSVTIAAENAHTQRVLEQHSELMQSNLRANGTNLASWQTVNESRQETYAQDYNGSSKNPYFRRDDAQQHTDDDNTDTTFADIIAAM